MRIHRTIIALACGSLVAGCALQPTYERPPLPVAATYPAYPGDTAGGGSRPAAEIGWRDFLTDARLQKLMELALANNRDLRVAALNVAQVQAQYRIQQSALFPQVDGGASASRGNQTQKYTADLSVSWELDFFGRLRSLSDAALQQYLASDQARRAFQILLVSQVADQYLAMLAGDEMIAVTQHTLETARASYDLAQLQQRVGTGTELTVRQAETVVEQAQANLAAQQRARAQAENGLVLLVGAPLPADLPPATPLDAQRIVADIPAGLPSDLLTRRPDVMQAEALLRSANANIGAARAAFFPSISLTGDLGSTSSALAGLFGGGSLAWSFVPALVAPIFNAGRLQAELDVAKVEKDIRVAQYEKAIQSAFREVVDGLTARATYDRQVASLERLTAASGRSLELGQLQFNTGTTSYLTVLTAQQTLYAAQTSLIQARLARMTNLVDLYRELGGGWQEHGKA